MPKTFTVTRTRPSSARSCAGRSSTGRPRRRNQNADRQFRPSLVDADPVAEYSDGYQYSQFVDLYRRFERKLSVVLRQHHRAGEKVFVDFCDGLPLIDPATGEFVPTQLFVGALGASFYTFSLATLSQALPFGSTVTFECMNPWAALPP